MSDYHLFESLISPSSNIRPILGKIKPKSSGFLPQRMPENNTNWSSKLNHRIKGADDWESQLSKVGSPLKYSPLIWSESVHFDVKPKQRVPTNVFFDEDSSDSKEEFESNGVDVPLVDNKAAIKKNCPTNGSPDSHYQLFDNFSYWRMSSAVGENQRMSNKNKRRVKTQLFCAFCKNNNETPDVYNSHVVKDPFGRTTCPVLRNYDCPKCRSGGGDNGHTIRYCPLNKQGTDDYIPSVIKQLKNSRSADGKKRVVV